MRPRLSPASTRTRPYAAPVPGLRPALLVTGLCLLLAVALPAAATAAAPSKDDAIAIAVRLPQVQRALGGGGQFPAAVSSDGDTYAVQFFDRTGEAQAEVDLDVLSGRVLHVFTGTQARFPLARGPQSSYATRTVDALWVWLPMTLIFLGAFFDWRRPWRLLHFDLVAI